MKFSKWTSGHKSKLETIIENILDKSVSDIIDYFEFDNMKDKESDFCPLYRTFTKCHVTNKLNCFLCGCPYFKYSDREPIAIVENKKIMSVCTISSKQAKSFEIDGIVQCDCSILPQYVKTTIYKI